MRADYTYFGNDLAKTITYANGASIAYDYDHAQRIYTIEHKDSFGAVILKMTHDATLDGLPREIVETGALGASIATVTYTYDTRRRLIAEKRRESPQQSVRRRGHVAISVPSSAF